jgi:hypothetical protein
MARMPTLLELAQMDRRNTERGAMRAFTNAMIAPPGPGRAAQPAAPAPQPARAPAAAPMPAQAPAPAPERRGLLGGFFGPEGRDARARLAIGLEGMTLNPNEALIGQLQRGIEGRETERQQNKTLEWLASLNTPQAQRALQYAEATGDVIGATKMALEQAPQAAGPEIREVDGRLVAVYPDMTVRELYGSAPAGFRQVTGAQLGLTGPDAEKLFNVSPENQVTAIGGAGTTITMPGETVKALPNGGVLVTDPSAPDGFRVVQPPGSQAATEASAAEAAKQSAADTAQDSINLIDSIITDPNLGSITGMFQGRLPAMTQAGTDLEVKVEQLQGQAFLQAFESLKGGGAITEAEGKAATAATARLNRRQSDTAYVQALNELKTILERGKRRSIAGVTAKAGDIYSQGTVIDGVTVGEGF